MKKKVVSLGLAVVLSLSVSLTAFAASSSTGSNSSTTTVSGNSASTSSSSAASSSTESSSSASSSSSRPAAPAATTVEKALPGGAVAPATVSVAVVDASGQVSAVSLDKVVATASQSIVASAATAEGAVVTVQSLLTRTASPIFMQTVAALAQIKGSSMVVNNAGTLKTAAAAVDPYGNTIAAAGFIKNVTSGSLVMLMSVNADGTVEYVEGVVDPVTGLIMGVFSGTPAVITVLVLA